MPEDFSASADACYLALKTRDARFDGRFFTGVTSTGIYCRPVCKVKTPKRENCRFFGHAAQAESAGFRPCLRCRPELAPHSVTWSIQDASYILAHQAARLLDEYVAPTLPASRGSLPPEGAHFAAARPSGETSLRQEPIVAQLARRLGITDRHVRRIFEAQFGVSPLQYLQTRRLLTAKQLLTDTTLPVSEVALASGFASLRRFNAAFLAHYRLAPTQLRRDGATTPKGDGLCIKLGYRPPYDVAAMLAFFSKRAIAGVEFVDASIQQLGRTLRLQVAGVELQGWVTATFDSTRCQVELRVSDSLRSALPLVLRRVRALLDLDADPQAINAVLHASFPDGDGLRVPGTVDGFELAVRAVLGQQITVAAARTLAQRLVERFGESLATPPPGLTRLFPSAQVLAQASGDALGQLGIVRQRQAAIGALARAVAGGSLQLHSGVDVQQTCAALQALPGIGAWTAQYVAMRALRWPDAFPAGDVALHKALAVRGEREAEAASQLWKPWRSYAVLRAWARLESNPVAPAKTTKSIANYRAKTPASEVFL